MRKWVGFQRGINLGGWLSQCNYEEEHFRSFIQERDIRFIAEWGLDHVRIPIDYNVIEEENRKYKESGFKYISQAIDWCQKYGLHVLLDLHKTAGYSFDVGEREEGFFRTESLQERFYALWEEIARRYAYLGDKIAFELLNEVVDKNDMEAWNRISGECIVRIRRIAPEVKILVGGYWNNNVMAVKDLAVPADENIVYNFHCYDPLLFTHQGAGWVPEIPADFRIGFPLTMEEYRKITEKIMPDAVSSLTEAKGVEGMLDYRYFEALFEEAIQVAESRNVPLYCGEYGVIDLADEDSQVAWYRAIHTVFEKYGIGSAAWSYKEMNYGLVEEGKNGEGLVYHSERIRDIMSACEV